MLTEERFLQDLFDIDFCGVVLSPFFYLLAQSYFDLGDLQKKNLQGTVSVLFSTTIHFTLKAHARFLWKNHLFHCVYWSVLYTVTANVREPSHTFTTKNSDLLVYFPTMWLLSVVCNLFGGDARVFFFFVMGTIFTCNESLVS